MKAIRFRVKRTGRIYIGYIDGDVVHHVEGNMESFLQVTEDTFRMSEIELLAPCVPRQIICVSFNYRKHADECGVTVSREPSIFAKASHTVIGTGEDIVCPAEVKELAFGVELAIVVKRRMKNVKAEAVPHYIAGYCVANDITALDLKRQERNIFRAKSFDTFCPLGPWMENRLDPADLAIRSWVNGNLKQDARTSEMVYSPYEILSYISSSLTLDSGDIVLTGTPMGMDLLNEGDVVSCEIEGIGKISNRVVRQK